MTILWLIFRLGNSAEKHKLNEQARCGCCTSEPSLHQSPSTQEGSLIIFSALSTAKRCNEVRQTKEKVEAVFGLRLDAYLEELTGGNKENRFILSHNLQQPRVLHEAVGGRWQSVEDSMSCCCWPTLASSLSPVASMLASKCLGIHWIIMPSQ